MEPGGQKDLGLLSQHGLLTAVGIFLDEMFALIQGNLRLLIFMQQ